MDQRPSWFPGVACSDASAAITTPAPLWPTRRRGRQPADPGAQAVVRPSPPGWPAGSSRQVTVRLARRAGDAPPVVPTAARTGRARVAAIATIPVRAAAAHRARRGTDRTPARRVHHAAGVAPEAVRNRAPRPNGVPPRSASGDFRGRHATPPSSRPESRNGRSRRGSTRDRCAPKRSPRPGAPPPTELGNAGRRRPASIRTSRRRSPKPPGAVRASCSNGSRPPRRRSTASGTTRRIGSSRR